MKCTLKACRTTKKDECCYECAEKQNCKNICTFYTRGNPMCRFLDETEDNQKLK
jgi:hypothetical protein